MKEILLAVVIAIGLSGCFAPPKPMYFKTKDKVVEYSFDDKGKLYEDGKLLGDYTNISRATQVLLRDDSGKSYVNFNVYKTKGVKSATIYLFQRGSEFSTITTKSNGDSICYSYMAGENLDISGFASVYNKQDILFSYTFEGTLYKKESKMQKINELYVSRSFLDANGGEEKSKVIRGEIIKLYASYKLKFIRDILSKECR